MRMIKSATILLLLLGEFIISFVKQEPLIVAFNTGLLNYKIVKILFSMLLLKIFDIQKYIRLRFGTTQCSLGENINI